MTMDAFLKMNVFFAVTTLAVVCVTVLVVIILIYVARLLSTLNTIATEVEEETQEIREDIGALRRKTKQEGLRLASLLSFFGNRAKKAASRAPARKKRAST